jgi:predicted GNAT superfamily acetyltransferase
MIIIRPLTTHDELLAVEQLQRDAWGVPDIDVVPLHMLITPPRHGGLLLGAFDGDRLAGFVFGFLGLTPDGRLKHCSHMAGVHPDYRDHGVGYSLKLAQRDHVLAQGLDLVTWTFDPLETRNAWLNFHKLGVICNTYIRNLYGAMRAAINAGPPSDRFEVEWWIRSERVVERLATGEMSPSSNSSLGGRRAGGGVGEMSPSSNSSLGGRRAGGGVGEMSPSSNSSLGGRRAGESPAFAFVVPICCGIPGAPPIEPIPWPRDTVQVSVEVPANFQHIKAADMDLALRWRLATRQCFEDAFAAGYQVTDLLRHDDRCHYLLEPASGPSAPH